VPDPYDELPDDVKERVIGALRAWAQSQADASTPVLRFLDGSALAPQDLLDEEPPGELFLSAPERAARGELLSTAPPEATGRAWRHLLNLVAVSLREGEDLDEILAALRPVDHEEPA
jgi:hypothetical protein